MQSGLAPLEVARAELSVSEHLHGGMFFTAVGCFTSQSCFGTEYLRVFGSESQNPLTRFLATLTSHKFLFTPPDLCSQWA